jgi:hypothetical protein
VGESVDLRLLLGDDVEPNIVDDDEGAGRERTDHRTGDEAGQDLSLTAGTVAGREGSVAFTDRKIQGRLDR